ncbi:hypothetical protein NC651_004693 [Populus alba x Populus x berolinensis]|nr:hypothetical protein NC651_004693 [Populus alba x Populus x berolinensis]
MPRVGIYMERRTIVVILFLRFIQVAHLLFLLLQRVQLLHLASQKLEHGIEMITALMLLRHQTRLSRALFLRKGNFPRKADKSQRTSYIRKGNSLVRKPTSVAQSPGPLALSSSVYQLNSSGTDEPKKSAGSDSLELILLILLNVLRTGGMDASFEKPRTPSLYSVSKISNRASNTLGGRASSPLAEHLHSLCTETVTVPTKLLESNDVPKSSDDVLKISESPITQNSQISNLECHSDPNDGNTVALANGKSLTYVKRKIKSVGCIFKSMRVFCSKCS